MVRWANASRCPGHKWHLDRFIRFAQLIRVTNTQTHSQTHGWMHYVKKCNEMAHIYGLSACDAG